MNNYRLSPYDQKRQKALDALDEIIKGLNKMKEVILSMDDKSNVMEAAHYPY